jgi:hypothetical protein
MRLTKSKACCSDAWDRTEGLTNNQSAPCPHALERSGQLLLTGLGATFFEEKSNMYLFNDLIERACRFLPDGYKIVIECRQGASNIKLMCPDRLRVHNHQERVHNHQEEESLDYKVNLLLEAARQLHEIENTD